MVNGIAVSCVTLGTKNSFRQHYVSFYGQLKFFLLVLK
jgi:hypothetical protein